MMPILATFLLLLGLLAVSVLSMMSRGSPGGLEKS